MQTIRRLYLYVVAFISLEVVLWGAIGLARSMLSGEGIGNTVEQLAGALALTLVGVPVFLIHWLLAQRGATRQPEEREARTRAVFLYAALLATLIPVTQNGLALLNRLLLAIFRLEGWRALVGGNQTTGDNLVAILFNLLAAAYFFVELRKHWQNTTPELQPGDTYRESRRLYRYIWLVYSLVMTVVGVQQVIKFIVESAGGMEGVIGIQLANGLALLLIYTPIWVFSGNIIETSLHQPQEGASTLRLVVLYLLALSSVLGLLLALGVLLAALLKMVLGGQASIQVLLLQVQTPLSLAVPLWGVSGYYGRMLRAEINQRREPLHREALGRIIVYILNLAGLAATFTGLQMLLSVMLDLGLGGEVLGSKALASRLAAALATLLVGVLVWGTNWRNALREAEQENESGEHARRSLVRKSYLYLALFAGVMGAMFSGGGLLYQLIRSLLGSPPDNLLLQSAQLFKLMVLFLLLFGHHWHILRADGRQAERLLIERHARFPVIVLAMEDTGFGNLMLKALNHEVTGLPIAMHSSAHSAPDEELANASAVILPASVLAQPPEAIRTWLQAFQGQRVVVPTPAQDWHWIAGEGLSLRVLAQRTARLVRCLAEGEEPPKTPSASPWLWLAYLLAALFGLQVLLGLASLGISMIVD